MQSMMEELYQGNIGFDSRYYGQDSPFAEAANEAYNYMEQLRATLNDNEKELLEHFVDAHSKMESITRYTIYAETLIFGIRLMTEVLTQPPSHTPSQPI